MAERKRGVRSHWRITTSSYEQHGLGIGPEPTRSSRGRFRCKQATISVKWRIRLLDPPLRASAARCPRQFPLARLRVALPDPEARDARLVDLDAEPAAFRQ